jgi:uncharacterized protein YaaR (DUF327 family)
MQRPDQLKWKMRRNAKPRNQFEIEDRERALAVLARMRRNKMSLRGASMVEGTDSTTVKRYVGSALWKDKSGHYRPTRYDRIPRTLNFFTTTGPILLTVRDSRTASKIAKYSSAVRKYIVSADASALDEFKHKSFRSGGVVYRFLTTPDALDLLADAGSLKPIESLYYARVAS